LPRTHSFSARARRRVQVKAVPPSDDSLKEAHDAIAGDRHIEYSMTGTRQWACSSRAAYAYLKQGKLPPPTRRALLERSRSAHAWWAVMFRTDRDHAIVRLVWNFRATLTKYIPHVRCSPAARVLEQVHHSGHVPPYPRNAPYTAWSGRNWPSIPRQLRLPKKTYTRSYSGSIHSSPASDPPCLKRLV
jgi:hypothetical protein